MRKIYILCLIIAIPLVIAIVQQRIHASNKLIPQVSNERKYALRIKILEAQNLNWQVQDITNKRDKAVQDANSEIDKLFSDYKLNKKDFTLDDNINFVPIDPTKK